MSLNRFYYLLSAMMLSLAGFVYLSPALVTPDFIYPKRIDSMYVNFHSVFPESDSLAEEESDDFGINLYNPGSLHLEYENINIQTADSLTLRGWFIPSEDTPANTILILHDLNQSKITYLEYIRQFHERNLNVCIFDLRAHGNSGGEEFSVGLPSVIDIKLMIDHILGKPGVDRLAIMGIGLGSALAMQVAANDGRCDLLILQSPFIDLETYMRRYARNKWGVLKIFWYPVFHRKVEATLGYPINELSLIKLGGFVKTPTLFIGGAPGNQEYSTEILLVMHASAAIQKELFLFDTKKTDNFAETEGQRYFNHISEFMFSALPKKQLKTKFRKLAIHDQ